MRTLKIFLILFMLINCFLLSGNENKKQEESIKVIMNKIIHDNTKEKEKIFFPSISNASNANIQEKIIEVKTKVYKKKPKTKITITNKQKAAIIVNSIGATIFLTGAGLLAGSLVYLDYLEKKETDYNKYIMGKKTVRGLFYGSMGGFGAGAVCITVSIPLFIKTKKSSKNK